MTETITLGGSLSFKNRFDDDLPFMLSEICHYKEGNNTFYLQSPKLDLLRSIMNEFGVDIELDESGRSSYDKLTRVHVVLEPEKRMFHIYMPNYPFYPLFTRSKFKRWTWKNMTRRVSKESPIYEAKHVYQLIASMEWLENEGYVITTSDEVSSYLQRDASTSSVIESMDRSPDLDLKPHQIDDIVTMDGLNYKGIIGDHPGMGKCLDGRTLITLSDGETIAIQSLFDRSLIAGESVVNGTETLVKLPGVYIPSYDGKKWIAKEIGLFYRQEIQSPMIKIITGTGNEMICTVNHKFSMFDPETGERWVKSSDLRVGDFIANELERLNERLKDKATGGNHQQTDVVPVSPSLIRSLMEKYIPSRNQSGAIEYYMQDLVAEGGKMARKKWIRMLEMLSDGMDEPDGTVSVDAREMVGDKLHGFMNRRDSIQGMIHDASNKYYDEIVEISFVKSRNRFVYDLHVPGTHNFVASNGMLCHNTITAGEITWKLWNEGRVKRVLWVVPTSPLVTQVHDEMKNRYGLVGKMVTGQTIKPKERLGVFKGEKIGDPIYGKHGFVITTWSMFVRDFTGKNFHDITKNVHFDLVFWDEGHRSKYGNKAHDAVLNMTAPYRVILSGTIMPNGRWEELHDMVSSVNPQAVMAKWFFNNIEDRKAEQYAEQEEIERPDHEARKDVTVMVMTMLMKHVAIHSKEEFADLLPKLVESSVHVPTNKEERKVIDNLIGMLSESINKWKKSFPMKRGSESERKHYYMVESAKNMLWQDIRRFCSHGAFHLSRRMKDIRTNPGHVHAWIQKNFKLYLDNIEGLMATGRVRMQPKNPKVMESINHINPERCLIFNDSVMGSILLAKYLKKNGMNVKVIVGSDDQFTREDADFLEQPRRMKDAVIEEILEWFWFPWMTISRFTDIDEHLHVSYTGEDGVKRDRIYYVNAHELGKEFSIDIEWDQKIPARTYNKILKAIDEIDESPDFSVKADTPGTRVPETGWIVIKVRRAGNRKDRRVLITTDKLNEGANLQIAKLVIFYDHPLSIKQKEQRIARSRRMESMHESIGVLTILMGLDYAIERTLGMKYETAGNLGYADPNPVSMKDVLKIMKQKDADGMKELKLLDFLGGEVDESKKGKAKTK